MRAIATITALVVLFIPTFTKAADDTFIIKLRTPAKGDTILVDIRENQTYGKKIVSDKGKTLHDKDDKRSSKYTYVQTTLQPGTPIPDAFERLYRVAEETMGDQVKKLAFVGKKIVFKKEKGKYVAEYKDGSKPGFERGEMRREAFNAAADGDFLKFALPKKPVRVGDAWKFETKEIIAMFGSADKPEDFDLPKVKGAGKLTKVYRKNGSQFGVLEFEFELPVKFFGEGEEKLDLIPGGRNSLKLTLDCAIDGSSSEAVLRTELIGKDTGHIAGDKPGTKYTMTMYLKSETVKTVKEEKPK